MIINVPEDELCELKTNVLLTNEYTSYYLHKYHAFVNSILKIGHVFQAVKITNVALRS